MPYAKLALLLIAISGAAPGADNAICARCHTSESRTQPATPMGRALLTAKPAAAHTKPLRVTLGRFTYSVETHGAQASYRVSDGEREVRLPIHWIFGAGAQTFVLQQGDAFIESMVSYYPTIDGLDKTMGDQGLNPTTLDEALGRKLDTQTVTACFGCHSTHAETQHRLDLAQLTPGLTCQRCHENTEAHAASMTQASGGNAARRSIPEQIGKRSAEGVSAFCGQCHRTWESVVRNNWRGESNVRFQPYRLANSKCFDGADARISCVACHNPHEDLVRDTKAYDAKCEACHATATAQATAGKTCPVEKSNCVSCHMPKVELPGGHQTFTDHNIRVVKAHAPYPD